MTAARFCPQCGTKAVPKANFCAACGEALPGADAGAQRRPSSSSSTSRPELTSGLIVLSLYLVVGIGLWMFVLRTQPFPQTVAGTSGGPASTGGSQTLPQDHPPVTLPEEVKTRIAELVDKANATPQDVNAWRTLAEVQFRASQIDASYRSAALSSYRHVLDLIPNDPDALRGIGNVYYDFEEYAKAIEYYQQYLTLRPEDPNVRTDLGTMYLYSRDVDRAIAEYQAVLAKQPDFFQAQFNLGIAYQEKGEPDKARAALMQAKSLTTDENVRARVDQVLAQFNGGPPASQATAPPNLTRTPFQQAVEELFRSHEIMGPRIVRIEWPTLTGARILFQNFPMAGMPPEVRERFLSKLRTQLTEAQNANNIHGTVTIELIDVDTQNVMDTISTAIS